LINLLVYLDPAKNWK